MLVAKEIWRSSFFTDGLNLGLTRHSRRDGETAAAQRITDVQPSPSRKSVAVRRNGCFSKMATHPFDPLLPDDNFMRSGG